MQNKWIGLLLIVVFGLGIYAALVISPPGFEGQDVKQQTKHLNWYPQQRALFDFELTRHTGEPFTNEDLKGKWTLAFVGYTFCPDICPVTLAAVNSIYPDLTSKATKTPLQVWFLSVDPKRDTIDRLKEYVSYFNPDFVASTGSHDQLFPLVRSMGMMYSLSESTDNPNYLVDHSGSIVVINPQGNVIGRFKPKQIPGQMAVSDTAQIMEDMPILLKSE